MFFVTSGDTPILFQAINESFNPIPQVMQGTVEGTTSLSAFVWNGHPNAITP